ncbi:MAG TPA: amidohydrolase family protein [Acholeplasmataceae bacterium]|nr:amidohydrolase family protein [Acholeplasmataceae bacterium]
MSNSNLYADLRKKLDEISIVDAHNHLSKEEDWISEKEDFTSLLGYAGADLVNAGMDMDALPAIMDERWKVDIGYDSAKELDALKKWELIKPYWPYVKNIGSGDVVRTALRLFFDCDDLDEKTIPMIQDKINDYKKPGVYKEILTEGANIGTICNVVMNIEECPSTNLFAPQLYTDTYATIQKRRDVYRLEQESGKDIYSLKTYVEALDTLIEKSVDKGLVGLKWHIWPYIRDFNFQITGEFEASKALDRILKMPARGGAGASVAIGIDEMIPFQNYIQNHLVQLAIELDLPIQIHTGTLGLSHGGPLNNGDPSKLISLFLRYPKAKFNLLHTSFPYLRVLGAISHIFPNVYINASWLDILSPLSFRQFMKDWLTGIPCNKIIAYGADQYNPFLVPAVAHRVRNLLAEVLTELVTEGNMTEDESVFAGAHLLRKNAVDLWKLDSRNIPK